MKKYDYSSKKNSLERELCPIESSLMQLSEFASGQNVQNRCLAYANRFIDKKYAEYQIERAVDVWLDTGKGFPSFSDLRMIADSLKPRVDVSEERTPCPQKTCDGSQWVSLVDDRGNDWCGKCKCHPEQNDFAFSDMLSNYTISPQYKDKIDAMYRPQEKLRGVA